MPKLTIELIPQTSFFKNIRSLVSQTKWNKIKKIVFKKANYKCEICNGQGNKHPVECHEIWDYKDGIQKLKGLIALCPKCHMVKHYGYTQIRGLEHVAIAHIQKINNWTKKETIIYIQQCFKIWRIRSQKHWKLNMEFLKQLNYD